jgi:hypothetical protein
VLDKGGSVMMGTNLTSAGHVVLLAEVIDGDDGGVVINDPYGLALAQGQYLKNGGDRGEATKVLGAADPDRTLLTRRTRRRPDVPALFAEGQTGALPGNMGQGVFYVWSELAGLRIGKWNTQISK